MGDYVTTDSSGVAVTRIRTPHPHDVLCGRGGGINSHAGNRTFRDWVRQRKNSYNLATSKAEKARVAKEVIAKVTSLDPPGRFLQRDTSGTMGSFWIEIDEMKAMAKTSQALREGAPTIRAQHRKEDSPRRASTKRTRSFMSDTGAKAFPSGQEMLTPATSVVAPSHVSNVVPHQQASGLVAPPLMSNAKFQEAFSSQPSKRQRTEDAGTPTLLPATASESPTNLSLSNMSVTTTQPPPQSTTDWRIEGELRIDDFVNPFENEEEAFQSLRRKDGYISWSSFASNICPCCGTEGKTCVCGSISADDWPLLSVL
eukprot:CAMPEP_0116541896 /NCGR_PEP_ID=MMETSP0397-20121206/725_1 /TAXON_ID=216820 /ORGANISM="Cyclophora tenuis, Strain ECT3854" /LENGTH=312 /DNA_ID=CAMNT_0004065865 /DNA_START=21 /DNA_END=959 /DNA_ORIENTATION=-